MITHTQEIVIFASNEDAQKVFEQLPQAKIIGNQVYCSDKRALQLAITTAGVTGYTSNQAGKQYYLSNLQNYEGDKPSIYVACLSAYNSGYLHGLWIDATKQADEIQDDINFMLSHSPVVHLEACEEWAIHDFEGFDSFNLREYEDLETVSAIAKGVYDHGEAFAAYIACEFPCMSEIKDWDEVVEKFQACYLGHFESEKDFVLKSEEVEQIYDFTGLQKAYPFWSNHIDWEGLAVDLFCSDYYSVKAKDKGYGVYVFKNVY